jgi:uncharacterized protein YndB with AHSA1/START domain
MAEKITIERTYQASVEELWDLWTTKDGFASWWGPQGFRADVHVMEGRPGGTLRYDMVADTPEMVAAMKAAGRPASHPATATFTEFSPHRRLVMTSLIDFLPGVEPYDNAIAVDFAALPGGRARMTVTLSPMHTPDFSEMQKQGFTSQLSKLDQRYGWTG